MKPACFADSSYYFALLNPRDEAHEIAVRVTSLLDRPVITTAWVLTEVADGLANTPSRGLFYTLLEQLRASAMMTIVPPSSELFDSAIELYAARRDKQWSLTDCVSFHVMQEREIIDALTADHHFEQAGFVALLT